MDVARPLQLVVYEHLIDKIINNEMNYHEIYSETKLAKDLGVSRTPFRDAVHRLSQEGYIDILPGKGFMLHKLSIKDIEELFQVRSAIESYCTLLIAKNHNEKMALNLFKELDRILNLQQNIIESSRNIKRFAKYDYLFHMNIVEYSENSIFKSMFEKYHYRIKKFSEQALGHEYRMENTCSEHVAILETMKKGDVENIYETTMIHMDTVKTINLNDVENL
jgi:DNA-binding GntR family transcriptional regulator